MKPETCMTCPFYVKRGNAPRPGITFDGECHIYPPFFIYPLVNATTRASSFSPVRSTDWCSLHPSNSSLEFS